MGIKNWFKLTFEIDSNLEDLLIWKFNDLGIISYSFEYLLENKNIKKVNVWLPTLNWDKYSKKNLETKINDLLNISAHRDKFFNWNVIEEEDWLTSWKKFWKPEHIGKTLLILPCWINLHEQYKNKKIIKIDPGAAFGTGSHPSTNLCLEKMESVFFIGKKVLDIGSGSGILSVAAKSLGAKEICAVDNDYLAINATKSNFQLNFGNLVSLKTYLGEFNEVISRKLGNEFDFILCNILAEVIKDIMPYISSCLKINGEVILSGILDSQKDEILKKFKPNNLKLIDISSRKDWACIVAKKQAI